MRFENTAVLVLKMVTLIVMVSRFSLQADKKKKADAKTETELKMKATNYSYIVWPNPPAVANVNTVNLNKSSFLRQPTA
jgi:hypothetical protein